MTNLTDQNPMIRQIHELQKTTLNSSLNAMGIFQARMEKMMNMFWDQTTWTSERVGNAMTDWTKAYQEGCDALTKAFGGSFGSSKEDKNN